MIHRGGPLSPSGGERTAGMFQLKPKKSSHFLKALTVFETVSLRLLLTIRFFVGMLEHGSGDFLAARPVAP